MQNKVQVTAQKTGGTTSKKLRMLWSWMAGFALAAGLGFAVLAYHSPMAAITPPAPTAFDQGLVTRGEKLAAAGFCASCHTVPGGKSLAGGLPLVTGFGTIYATNITPDVETGIGSWSLASFTRAMRQGVSRDGSHLFPAFPYDRFTQMADEDISALYAFLMTRPAIQAPNKPVEMPFPLNVRALQAGWKLLFFKDQRYTHEPTKNAEWNRGAYLAEGVSHCSSCHTPRNPLGAEKSGSERYSGAMVDGWFAPALSSANTSPVPWTSAELYAYLRHGGTPLHGVATGPMSHVVYQGLAVADDSDVRALATYFASINGSANHTVDVPKLVNDALAKSRFSSTQPLDRGASIYANACAACHYNAISAGPQATRPELGLKSSLHAADPTNLVQVILHGVSLHQGLANTMMPAFGHALSDADITSLVVYLRKTRTNLPPWPGVAEQVARMRDESVKK